MRTSHRLAYVMLGVLAGALLAAPPASAHATYVDSDPAKGAAVSSPPSEVWVQFSEGVDDGSKLEVFDECGEQVDNGDSRISGLESDTITVSLSADKVGAYRVTWHVLSDDGHPVGGEYTFRASGGDPCPGEQPDDGGNDDDPGGGGGSGKTGGGGTGGGRGDTPNNPTDTGGGSAPSAGNHKHAGGGHKGGAHGGGKSHNDGNAGSKGGGNTTGGTTNGGGGDQLPRAAGDNEESAEIPLDALLIGFGFAALLGAAGGIVYAGIVAPRD